MGTEVGNCRDLSYLYEFDGNSSSRHSHNDEKNIREKWWFPKEDEVVFDIGAGYGSYSLPAAAAGATVYAFEPYPVLIETLSKSIALNPSFKIELMPFGLYQEETVLETMMYSTPAPVKLRVRKVDDVVAELKLDRLDWMKIDTEGYEIPILKGARRTIEHWHPKIVLEVHSFMPGISLSETLAELAQMGYNGMEFIRRSPCEMVFAKKQ